MREGVLVREIGDEVLILDTEADRIHRLNASAGLVWRMQTRGEPFDAIVGAFVDTYDVSSDVASADIRDIITSFERLGLAGPTPDANSPTAE